MCESSAFFVDYNGVRVDPQELLKHNDGTLLSSVKTLMQRCLSKQMGQTECLLRVRGQPSHHLRPLLKPTRLVQRTTGPRRHPPVRRRIGGNDRWEDENILLSCGGCDCADY